jgi:hypothetical protein
MYDGSYLVVCGRVGDGYAVNVSSEAMIGSKIESNGLQQRKDLSMSLVSVMS